MNLVLDWNIFCKVIDNYGDLGVCWRLTRQLLARGQRVCLYLDDLSLLEWMGDPATLRHPNFFCLPWEQVDLASTKGMGDVVIEAFGCELPSAFQARIAAQTAQCSASQEQDKSAPVWLNLEYLSAEPFVAHCHGLRSPVGHGPARGLNKWFFYPGFSAQSGGLLRADQAACLNEASNTTAFLQNLGIDWHGERLAFLFCYASISLNLLELFLKKLAEQTPTLFLVAYGQSQQAVQALLEKEQIVNSRARMVFLPALYQTDFDTLLALCDIHFVRGEDSLVQALWTGKPVVWQIYPQSDGAHITKLQAFLDTLGADENARAWHWWWNGLGSEPVKAAPGVLPTTALLQQADLCTRLLAFVQSKRG